MPMSVSNSPLLLYQKTGYTVEMDGILEPKNLGFEF